MPWKCKQSQIVKLTMALLLGLVAGTLQARADGERPASDYLPQNSNRQADGGATLPPSTRHAGAPRDPAGQGDFPNNGSGSDNSSSRRADAGAQTNAGDSVEPGNRRPRGHWREAGQHGSHGGFLGGPLDLRPLKLSDEQKQKIREIHNLTASKAHELRQTLRSRRTEMRDLMFDPQATAVQIRTKRKEIRQLQDKMDEMLVEDFIAIRATLTAEQRQLLPEVKPKPPDFAGPGQREGSPARQKNPAG